MYITWTTIKIIIAGFIAVCVGFSSVCVAGGWLIKIVKGLKKPSENVQSELKEDKKKIGELEADMKYISSAIGVLMRSNLVILAHMRTNNNTGQMEKMEQEIQQFLIDRE